MKINVSLAQANALKVPIKSGSVQCVVTSPPYYGLRDYGEGDQLGLEPTLQEYIDNTVKWSAEVWRVLRDDGTFWLNIGDSFAGSGGGHAEHHENPGISNSAKRGSPHYGKPGMPGRYSPKGFKPKDLMLVPHRVAIALQEWGWYVRSDIVWHKPNPMPESVTDRPTKAHEYIFLLTKNKKYYYDANAIREKQKKESFERANRGVSENHKNLKDNAVPPGSNTNSIHKKRARGEGYYLNPDGRNKRSVWKINTSSYKGAHFATFPPELPEICIKAGSKKGDIILDPFGGSGTTAMIANRLGRYGISLDLSWEYLQMAKERTNLKGFQEWQEGEGKKAETVLDDLPMFDLTNKR